MYRKFIEEVSGRIPALRTLGYGAIIFFKFFNAFSFRVSGRRFADPFTISSKGVDSKFSTGSSFKNLTKRFIIKTQNMEYRIV